MRLRNSSKTSKKADKKIEVKGILNSPTSARNNEEADEVNGINSQDRWSEANIQKVIKEWNLTEEEQAQLWSLHKDLVDINHWKNCPHVVMQFMQGPLGYSGAESSFRNMIKWRLKNNIDSVLKDYKPPQLLLDSLSNAVLEGLDYEGDPIYVKSRSSIDPSDLIKRFGQDTLLQHSIWTRELQTRGQWHHDYEQRMGRAVKGFTVIFDLKGISAKHVNSLSLELLKMGSELTNKYYVGMVKKLIIIRAPAIFRVMWISFKHFLPSAMTNQTEFASSDRYLDVLDKYMDREILPPCICPDSNGQLVKCMRSINMGVEPTTLPPPSKKDYVLADVSIWTKTETDEKDYVGVKVISISCGILHTARNGSARVAVA